MSRAAWLQNARAPGEENRPSPWRPTRFGRAFRRFQREGRLKQQVVATARLLQRSMAYGCSLPLLSFPRLQPQLYKPQCDSQITPIKNAAVPIQISSTAFFSAGTGPGFFFISAAPSGEIGRKVASFPLRLQP